MCGSSNERQQLTVSNRAFARGQRIFNEDVLPWVCRQFGITDWVLTLVPAEDADELRDEQLMSAKLDNIQKALQVGLEVEWDKDEYTVSGKPKLQEQYNEPIGLPQVTHSGEVSKSASLTKDCPAGQHEHEDFPYCHPADREHREGGGSSEGKKPSKPAENHGEEETSSIDASESVEQLENAVRDELKDFIPDLKINLKDGDVKTCRTAMKQFSTLAKQYSTSCRNMSIKARDPRSYAGATEDGETIYLNTSFFSSNPGSTRPGAQRLIEDYRSDASKLYHPAVREGEEIQATLTHEFAHTLMSSDFSGDIDPTWQEYKAKFPLGVEDPEDPIFVSEYASTSKEEFIAECFVASMHTDTHSQTAAAVLEKINERFRRK